MQSNRLLALDGLRGVAALAVLLTHAQLGFDHGYLAVDLFFIISGYVIAASYEERLAGGALGPGAYMRLRLLRLYPMLFIGSCVGLVATLIGWQDWKIPDGSTMALVIVAQFLLLPAVSPCPSALPLNNPHWSIVWELLANLFHASWLARASNRVLVIVMAASAVAMIWAALHFHTLSIGWSRLTVLGGLPRVGFGFVAGQLLFRTRERWIGRVPEVPFVVPGLIFVAMVNMTMRAVASGPACAIYDLMVVLLGFVPLIMLTVRAKGGQLAAWLGAISYPLYAVHEPIIVPMTVAGYGIAARVLTVAAVMLCAWGLARLVDGPLNLWTRTRFGTKLAAAQPSLVAA